MIGRVAFKVDIEDSNINKIQSQNFTFLGPVCPIPPDTPAEGKREYEPRVFELEPTPTCAVDGEIVEFKCHSFLRIYIQTATFGRIAANLEKMCDEEKKADSNAPSQDCLDTSLFLQHTRSSCHGEYSCSISVSPTFTSLDSSCDGLQREARTNHICGKFRW